MLLGADHKRAAVLTLALAALAGAYYVAYDARTLNGASGGTPSGLVLGGASLALILIAALLGLRKRFSTWRLGRATTWMRAHIWLGLLALPLALFHSGFRWGGALAFALMCVLAAVVATGVLGLIMQALLPRLLTESVPLETTYEQIGHVGDLLRAEADDLVAGVSGGPVVPEADAPPPVGAPAPSGPGAAKPAARGKKKAPPPALEGSGKLKDFYVKEVRPWLARERAVDARFSEAKRREATFDRVRTLLPVPLHEALSDLESICDERSQLDAQRRLHAWLHGWLFVHVPLAAALVVLGIAHAILMLRY